MRKRIEIKSYLFMSPVSDSSRITGYESRDSYPQVLNSESFGYFNLVDPLVSVYL